MAYKKYNKRNFRKKVRKVAVNKRNRVPRPMKMQVYNFFREVESDIDLGRITAGGAGPLNLYYTTDGGAAGSYGFTFRMLPNYTEFPPLFKQWRINAVSTFIYPSANVFTAGAQSVTIPQNNNIMIRLAQMQNGTPIGTGNTVQDWNQLQAKKRWIVRPNQKIQLYTKLKQRYLVQGDPGLPGPQPSQWALKRSGWIDTTLEDTIHYGHNIRFDSLDPALAIESTADFFPHLKIIQRVYFQCKGVK